MAKLLVVDDEKNLRLVIQKEMSRNGHEADTAGDGDGYLPEEEADEDLKALGGVKGDEELSDNVWTIAKNHIEKGLSHAYRDRRLKKRTYRRLWIVRINAAARLNGTTYSRLMHGLNQKGLGINRKVLADIAMNEPQVFARIVQHVQS